MTVGDLLFPLPSPGFLFIHAVTLRRPLSSATDARGKPVTTYDVDEDVAGYLTAPDRTNEDSAGTDRIKYDAVCLLDNCLGIVPEGTLLKCDDPQLPPTMAGTYRVVTSRPNLSHNRLLVQRYTGPWEENV